MSPKFNLYISNIFLFITLLISILFIFPSPTTSSTPVKGDSLDPQHPQHHHAHLDHLDPILNHADTNSKSLIRIAIIGSGIGGSSAAHFLKEKLGDGVELFVFEKNETVGGRVRYVDIKGARVELGGSIYHLDNRYFASFVNKFGLKNRSPRGLGTFGIWDGKEFVLEESEWSWLTLSKLLYRYFLDPIRAKNLAEATKDDLLNLYDMLENTSFPSTRALLEAVNLFDITQKPCDAILREAGVGDLYIRELLTSIHRVNYGQDATLNGLAGLVSLVGASDKVASVAGGNSQVVQKLLESAGAVVRTETTVTAIHKLRESSSASSSSSSSRGGRYSVHARHAASGTVTEEEFDYVIVATPLELTDIEFVGGIGQSSSSPSSTSSTPDENSTTTKTNFPPTAGKRRPYQTTWATFVVAEGLNPKYFGRNEANDFVPTFVLTTESPSIPFSSAAALTKIDEHEELYKVFSRTSPDDSLLDQLFKKRSFTLRQEWKAYPVLRPSSADEWPQVQLDEGLLYANAMESAVSAIETEIISSRNVANLVLKAQGKL